MADINFPSNPSLNDTYSFGGKTWRYNGSVWLLEITPLSIRLDSAFNHANSAYDAANTTSTDTWVRDAANSASSYANSGYTTANSSQVYANAAFAKANTIESSLTGGSFELSVQHNNFVGDNTSNTFTLSTTPVNENYLLISINGVVQHKSSYNIISSNVVFNDPPELDDNIDVVIFTGSNSSIPLIFDSVNSASSYSNSAYLHANAAYDAANNATDTWVRTAANSASSYANGAYSVANTANTLAQAAYDAANNAVDTWVRDAANSASSYANGAYVQANTGNILAQAAFAKANSVESTLTTITGGGSFEISVQHNNFVGDNTSNTFTLSVVPSNENYLLISINGVVQHKSSYNVVSSNVVFNDPPELDDNIDVVIFTGSYTTSAYDHANAAFDAANNAVDTWVRDAANSASSYANGAYGVANTSNTLAQAAYDEANVRATISYVDNSIANLVNSAPVTLDTLNELATALNNDPSFATTIATNIGIISSYANSAYSSSNTNSENITIVGSYANSAFSKANTSLDTQSGGSITGDVSITGNLTVTGCTASLLVTTLRTEDHIIDLGYGTSGIPSQNAGIRVLRGDENPVQLRWIETENYWEYTNDGANYIKFGSYSDGVYANAAFDSANTADVKAVTSGDYANSGYSLANTANILAQAAFNAANNATDTWVRNASNSASSYANSAFIHANAAFEAANTGGGGSGTSVLRTYTGDGSTTIFTVTSGVLANNILVTENGIIQEPIADYSVTGTSLTFTTAPASGVRITIRELATGGGGSSEPTIHPFLLSGI